MIQQLLPLLQPGSTSYRGTGNGVASSNATSPTTHNTTPHPPYCIFWRNFLVCLLKRIIMGVLDVGAHLRDRRRHRENAADNP